MAFLEYVAATGAAGTLWPIIKEKIQEAGSDFIKDAFKESVQTLLPIDNRDAQKWQKAADQVLAKSLAKFIERSEVALEDAEADVGAYAAAFNDFLASGTVQKELARAFLGETPSSMSIGEVWLQMELRPLPEGFDWALILKQYQRMLTAAVGQTEVLKRALDTLHLSRIAENSEVSRPRTPGFNLAGYKKAIIASHGYLKLQQLTAEAQHKTPISMRNVFVDPYVIEQGALSSDFYCLPIEDQARIRSGILKEHHVLDGETIAQFTEILKNAKPQVGLTFVTTTSQPLIVLTGDPGSGKSTLLQYLSLEWAEIPDPAAFSKAPVPLLIELRRYAEQREKNPAVTDFPSYLQHGTDQAWQLEAAQVEAALVSGQAWLLLDGFDEVFDQAKRSEIISKITHATIAWKNIRIIVTTRSYGYKPEALQQIGFLHGHVQPFDDKQIATFLDRWHTQIADVDKTDLQARLRDKISRQSRMRELAGNPLLLTMMALLNRTSNLSDRRADLYSRCVDLLVHQWEAEVHRLPSGPTFGPYFRDSRQLSLDEKRALLRSVASHMQTIEGALAFNLIDSESLQLALVSALPAWVESCDRPRVAKGLVEQLQGRNYILASLGGGRFGFVHRTFLEYCCADYYLFQLKEEGSLNEEDFFSKTFALHWRDTAWAEILLLLASQLVPSRLRNVLERALQLTTSSEKWAACFAAKLLAESNNRDGLELVSSLIWNELNALMETPMPEHDEKNYDEKYSAASDVYSKAINAIQIGWNGTNEARDWLLFRSKHDPREIVRFHSVLALRNWKGDAQVRGMYEDLLMNDTGDVVRFGAAIFLIACWPPDQIMFNLYISCTSRNQEGILRSQALRSLAKFWPGDLEVQKLIISSLTDETNMVTRCAAVHCLSDISINAEQHAVLLEDKVRNDSSADVRKVALEEFAEHFSDKKELQVLLQEISMHDESDILKQCAVELQAKLSNQT